MVDTIILAPEVAVTRTGIDGDGVRLRAACYKKNPNISLERLQLTAGTIDLTTLEGTDDAVRVEALCARAAEPGEGVGPCAAVCVYPPFVTVAKGVLAGTGVEVATVAGAFPHGQLPLELKVAEVERTVADGATEVDIVVNRGQFLAGDYAGVYREVLAMKEACGDRARLKVILETCELEGFGEIRLASDIAMAAGADFIKTSTGKGKGGSTLEAALVIAEAVRDFHSRTVGVSVRRKKRARISIFLKIYWEMFGLLQSSSDSGRARCWMIF